MATAASTSKTRPSSSSATLPFADRRRTNRHVVAGQLVGRKAGTTEAVTILDMSRGGFLLETSTPFALDTLHRFCVALPDGTWDTLLTAAAVHGHQRTVNSENGPRYVTGFAFVSPYGIDAQARLASLVDRIASVRRMH